MDQKSVLLLGATGLVGGECLKLLCEDDFWNRVVVLTRRPLPPEVNHPKLEAQVIDFDHPEKFRDMIKAEQVISALGTTIKKAGSQDNFYRVDFTYPYQIAEIALKNGAEHLLLVSSSGADAKSGIFYSRVKGELDEAVSKLGYRSVSIFRPSLLLGDRKEFRLGEEIGKFFGGIIRFALPARYKPVHARAVAGAIIDVAKANQSGVRIIESDEIRRIY
jgi:uncharacterized protein YbjT (DUF2867 family)